MGRGLRASTYADRNPRQRQDRGHGGTSLRHRRGPGEHASAATVEEAASRAELVLVAIPFHPEDAAAVDLALTDEQLRELDELFPPGAAAGDRHAPAPMQSVV